MTMRYIGGGSKKIIRIVDFKRNKDGVPAVVKTIEYDPNRSARIALLFYADGEKRYIIAPNGLQVGTTLMSGEDCRSGNRKCTSASEYSGRYCNSQHRITSGSRRCFGSFSW